MVFIETTYNNRYVHEYVGWNHIEIIPIVASYKLISIKNVCVHVK